jgi:Fur family ferric uptake transcriptional regulator
MTEAPERQRLAFDDVDEIAAALRASGHRLTAARRVLLAALFAAGEPVAAQEIADGLDGRVPPSDVASVYRNLERLEALGVVRHVHVGHGASLYALDRADVEYLACERCGRVTGIAADRLDAARAAIRDAAGFEARFRHFPVHGVCDRCAGRAQTPTSPPRASVRRARRA